VPNKEMSIGKGQRKGIYYLAWAALRRGKVSAEAVFLRTNMNLRLK
jgi:hypothetical protein